MATIMSIYIPHVFSNITEKKIMDTFCNLDIGKVSNVDLVGKVGKAGPYNSAYVHFEYWTGVSHSINIQKKLKRGDKDVRIVYDDPWYWLIFENHAKKIAPNQRKTRIDLSGLNDLDTAVVGIDDVVTDCDKSFGQVEESYDFVDSEYANQLEDLVVSLRDEISVLEYDHKRRENLFRDEIESLKNQVYILQSRIEENESVRSYDTKSYDLGGGIYYTANEFIEKFTVSDDYE